MKILEEIWEIYISERGRRLSKEENKVVEELLEKEETILKKLDEELKTDFWKFSDLANELCALGEKEAFFIGAKFGIKFIIETLFCEGRDHRGAIK